MSRSERGRRGHRPGGRTATTGRALASLCLTQTVSWGVLYYSFPVALPAITDTTGWSENSVTGAFSVALVVAAIAGIPVGRIIDQRGPRLVMTSGSVLAVLATVAISAAPGAAWFVAAWIMAGLAQAAVLYAPAFTALTRWYGSERTRALVTLTLVAGLSSTIFAPVIARLLEDLSWRQTYLVLAALLAVTTIPGHAIGLKAPWPAKPAGRDSMTLEASTAHPRPKTVIRSAPFLFLTAAMAVTAFALFAATIHLIPLLTGRGLSAATAAWALGLSGAGQLLGRVGYAPLAARTTPRMRTVAVTALGAAAIATVGLVPGPATVLIIASIILGAARGLFTLLQSTVVSDRWGMENFGSLYGVLNAPTTIAMALAPWAGSVLAGALGGTPRMFVTMAALGALGAAGAILTAVPSINRHRRADTPPQAS